MKLESLVIVDQPSRGEYVPGPCTHRPSHHPSWGHPKPVAKPGTQLGRASSFLEARKCFKEWRFFLVECRDRAVEGVPGKGGEVVTR